MGSSNCHRINTEKYREAQRIAEKQRRSQRITEKQREKRREAASRVSARSLSSRGTYRPVRAIPTVGRTLSLVKVCSAAIARCHQHCHSNETQLLHLCKESKKNRGEDRWKQSKSWRRQRRQSKNETQESENDADVKGRRNRKTRIAMREGKEQKKRHNGFIV